MNERMRRRRSIGLQRGTGSSTSVSTALPLPALGIPNPVIIQNTRVLTGSLSQHGSPLGCSGPCGMCAPPPPHPCFGPLCPSLQSTEARRKLSLMHPSPRRDQLVFYRFHPKSKNIKKGPKLADTVWPLQALSLTNEALGKNFLRFLSLNLTSYAAPGHREGKPRSAY